MTKPRRNGDTTGVVKCSRCGAVMAALDFNVHQCPGRRHLGDLPTPILRRLAYREITEAEAWQLADAAQEGEGR